MSKLPKVPRLPYRPLCAALCLTALAGCATQPGPVQINLPQTFREPCARADLGALETVGDLGALVVRQEAAVAVCDARRAGVVAIVDGYTATTKPKRWRLPWSKR